MSDLVSASHVFLGCKATTVDEVMDFLGSNAVALGVASDADAVSGALKARESEGTTGMTGGFAIPHCKSDAISSAVVMVVKLDGGVEWRSADGQPVRCAIALLVPAAEAGTTHLQLLSQIAAKLMDESLRSKLLESDDPAAIAALVSEGL